MANTATKDQQKSGTDEQSVEDQAGAETSGVEEQDGTDEGTDEGTDDDEDEGDDEGEELELLTADEIKSLEKDPKALLKALNKAATKKFQGLSAERKALEPYAAFIKALDTNPVEAVTAVAKRLGIKISDADTSTEAKTAKTVDKLSDKITDAVRKSLGPEYEDLADKFGAAINDALTLAIPELTKGNTEALEKVIEDSALQQANIALESFGKTHPDWKKFEGRMMTLSAKFPPGEGVTELEYLEMLYTLASRDGKTGDGVKKVIQKMNKSAKGREDEGTSSSKVSNTPTKLPTFAEAAAAARRGERWE